jgi:hypothetical protein
MRLLWDNALRRWMWGIFGMGSCVESQAICHSVSQYLSVELAKLAFSKGFAFSIFFGNV